MQYYVCRVGRGVANPRTCCNESVGGENNSTNRECCDAAKDTLRKDCYPKMM